LHIRRSEEITAWLDEHPDVKNFVVLDDMETVFLKKGSYFAWDGRQVQTDPMVGVTESDVEAVLKIFEESLRP
jgi:hypothetical protein